MLKQQKKMDEFVRFVRTKQFMLNRLKDNSIDNSPVFISINYIRENFWKYPTVYINKLIDVKRIDVFKRISRRGYLCTFYSTDEKGDIDLSLVKPEQRVLNKLEVYMMNCLLKVSISDEANNLTDLFKCFLKNKSEYLVLFFTVDKFSSRIHTPITNLKKEHRKYLLIDNEKTLSIDVITIQPILLANILFIELGKNQFTDWIKENKDIYMLFKTVMQLDSREEGKEQFFHILFSYPNKRLQQYFGRSNWITWINNYKKINVPSNPYTKTKPHSNLAWLLQSSEVKILRIVWKELMDKGIVFLSVHDEIIVKAKDKYVALQIMNKILTRELTNFTIKLRVSDEKKTTTNTN